MDRMDRMGRMERVGRMMHGRTPVAGRKVRGRLRVCEVETRWFTLDSRCG